MADDNLLYKIDAVVADGVALPITDGSGKISGAARFENDVALSASGDDYNKRKRVPTLFKAQIQFGPSADPAKFAAMKDIQITARDTQSGRRALMPRCSFGSLGDIGDGPVDVVFNVLSPIQWL